MDARVLGIDEAGRGSVLGPLVVGGFLALRSRLDELPALGVRDSKLLSPARREILFEAIAAVGERFAVTLPPVQIDGAVARGELNLLEARAFAQLVKRTGATEVYVDACDPRADRFGRRVRSLAGTRARIVSAHHADRDVPVVAAASIVAKVYRDRAVARIRDGLTADFGSGYPSDLRTRRFVQAHLATPRARVPWLRYSWATVESLKPPPRLRTLDSAWPPSRRP
jgi:ribonuclease HII